MRYLIFFLFFAFALPMVAIAGGDDDHKTGSVDTSEGEATYEVTTKGMSRSRATFLPSETRVLFSSNRSITRSEITDGVIIPNLNNIQDEDGYYSLVSISNTRQSNTYAVKENKVVYDVRKLKKTRTIQGYTCEGYEVQIVGTAIFYEVWATTMINANYSPIEAGIKGFVIEYTKFTSQGRETVSLKEVTFKTTQGQQQELIDSTEKTDRAALLRKLELEAKGEAE